MSWVALVGPEIEENLSLRYLAASLGRAGFATAIVPFNHGLQLEWTRQMILSAPELPLLVAISLAFQWRAQDSLALAMALREAGYRGHITAGGHFGFFRRREILEDFKELDSICRHEAEETIVDLACALRDGKPLDAVEGLALRDSSGQVTDTPGRPPLDLGRLPWPDRRGRTAECLGHGVAPLVGSRGCHAKCAFCCISAWHREGGGKRLRLRPVEDLAEEMVWLHRRHGTDIFIFHDDNFFLPNPQRCLERINALADALETRKIGRFAVVVKARPPNVSVEIIQAMIERLSLVRLFLGVENASSIGLETLARRVRREHIDHALDILNDLGVYVSFNLLIFHPDNTLEDLETNLTFMERHADTPFNFSRVELYAGTPLLARMLAEGRCRGDYFGHDYEFPDAQTRSIFEIAAECFHKRNFTEDALANGLMGTRFDVEVCRHFHPAVYRPDWLERAKNLNRQLTTDSVASLREIIRWVTDHANDRPADSLIQDLSARLREAETTIGQQAEKLEDELRAELGTQCQHTRPLPKQLSIATTETIAETALDTLQ